MLRAGPGADCAEAHLRRALQRLVGRAAELPPVRLVDDDLGEDLRGLPQQQAVARL